MTIWKCAFAGAVLALAGCSEQGGISISPAKREPDDPRLAKIYKQTCKACHGAGVSGAPQTGREPDWSPRLARGMDELLDRTIMGYKGMPPLGNCAECNEDDFRALILFMAGREE